MTPKLALRFAIFRPSYKGEVQTATSTAGLLVDA
jgi:hypothetical protein